MHAFFLKAWWNRAPVALRLGLMVGSIVVALLGGAADGYWQ